ncbi:hypothetical protein [Ralstonia mannitolilytica]|uniref:hypothetical protein n=1 Tax=Ralstonia mannitolilytica TaxID=105219 RepID=UPI0012E752DA|nr:hypothetical protein [Ralstonia mannitolilytica]
MTTVIQTDVPLVNVPFVDPTSGSVSEPWFLFLIQLWRRTGGTSGVAPDSLTVADVLALEETFASGLPPIQSPFEIEAVMAQGSRQEPLLEMIFPPSNVPDVYDQTFSSGTDFTPGTTASLTLSKAFGLQSRTWVFFDGVFQGNDQYSISGTALNFTSAIPVGVSKVYVKGVM